MPKLIFLGTGTSTGVPQIGCNCVVCQSTDPKDKRLRTSALFETDKGERLLIDCGPDFREQMLKLPFAPIQWVLLTHEHYDHVGGLDDLRPFTAQQSVPIGCDAICAEHLRQRMPYCFVENKYPGVPQIEIRLLSKQESFQVCGSQITPIEVFHGHLPIYGYRIGDLVYITDMSKLPSQEKSKLMGCKILVVNALRKTEHHSHQSLEEALQLISEIHPQKVFLVHMSHEMGLHKVVQSELPKGVYLAYDGLQVQW